jgi:hypothetical protein
MVIVAGLLSVALFTCAQDSESTSGESSPQMPDIAEPRAPDPGEETGVLSGSKPFTLVTDPTGELTYSFNDDNEVESLTAKRKVVFTSEDMTLNCDQLDYKAASGELTAVGKKVIVRQGEVVATCKVFKYNPETQHSELEGNPIMYNRTRDGKVSTTAGRKILIATVNGKPQVKVLGGGTSAPSLNTGAESVPAPSTRAPRGGRAVITAGDSPAGKPKAARLGVSGQSKPVPASTPEQTTEEESTPDSQ